METPENAADANVVEDQELSTESLDLVVGGTVNHEGDGLDPYNFTFVSDR
jgi:hypothetical protein